MLYKLIHSSPFSPISVTDNSTGITVLSFKNGVVTQIINQIYKVDIAQAINIVQRQVKVPVNRQTTTCYSFISIRNKRKKTV